MEQVLSANLAKLRKEKGFRTQEGFAAAAGIPYRTYQDIERGWSWPQKQNVELIAKALGLPETELFRMPSQKPTPEEALKVIQDALRGAMGPNPLAQELETALARIKDLEQRCLDAERSPLPDTVVARLDGLRSIASDEGKLRALDELILSKGLPKLTGTSKKPDSDSG